MFSLPKFSLTADRYDQSTYLGRIANFMNVVDPRLVFVSQSRLDQAKTLLGQYKAGTLPAGVTDAQLWQARKIRDSLIHPDTGKVLPVPFRMSFFVFANVPICIGMIVMPHTTANALFWQWANQSYNAAFNYGNRNATIETDNTSLMMSYVTATVVACGVSLGLNRLVETATSMSPVVRTFVQRTVPFTAVALAGACNAVAMRYREAIDGIDIHDADGNVVGKSIAAGRAALMQVAATRMALPLPILMLPPYIIPAVLRLKFVAARPWLKLPVEVGVISLMILGALPCAIALFPQTATISRTSVEQEFHNYRGADGQLVEQFFYNKGL